MTSRIRTYTGPAAISAAGLVFLLAGSAEAAKVHAVDIGTSYFAPGKKTVRPGDKVRFVWEEGGVVAHDVGVTKGPAKFRSPLQGGGSWTTKKLRKAGTYRLACSQHPEMTMTLRVKKR